LRNRVPRRYFPPRVPAFVAPLFGFALGALLAWFSATAPRRAAALRATEARGAPPPARGRPLALVALFAALVFTPVCAYFLIFAPDWSFAYLVDTRRIPSALDLVLLLLDAGSVPAGFIAACGPASGAPTVAAGRFSAQRSVRTAAVLAGVPLAIALLAVLFLSRRLAMDGTYRQVEGDFGVHQVAGGPLGYALLWMHTMLAAGFIVTVRGLLARDAPAPRRPEPRRSARAAAADANEPPRGAAPPVTTTSSIPPRRLGVGRGTLSSRPGRRG
jgi:hypothetical protein